MVTASQVQCLSIEAWDESSERLVSIQDPSVTRF